MAIIICIAMKTINDFNNENQTDVEKISIIIAHVLNKNRAYVLAHPDKRLTIQQIKRISQSINEIKKEMPVAYIIGHKEFFGIDFFVDKNTLIPRPDTELMVECALEKIAQNKYDAILDIGTGSGCIAITAAKHINKKIKIIASDISANALKIAKKNAKRHNIKIKFIKSDLLKNINPTEKNILILANLPYLTKKQFDSEKSIQKEPRTALVAKEGGLESYKKLTQQIKTKMRDKNITMMFEIDPSQAEKIKKIIHARFPNSKIEIKKDLSGFDRLAIIQCAA
jgi:release factor glutamine methyltransferase